jgi:hypothetical protein
MDIYTLDRGFKRVDLIDDFESQIWKEGYYGEGNFELHVPLTDANYNSLALDTLMECSTSQIPMMLDTKKVEDGLIKVEGISILQWMNNRFIRSNPWAYDDGDQGVRKTWTYHGTPGDVMATLVQLWLIAGSTYFEDGDYYTDSSASYFWNDASMAIFKPSVFAIPGLSLGAYDHGGSASDISVNFGGVFDVLKDLSQTYSVGQKIFLNSVSDSSYSIVYTNYRGLDRTSGQSVRPVVKFSPELGPLKNVREFQSSRDKKTRVYIWTPKVEDIVAYGDHLETTADLRGTYFDDISKSTGFDKNYVGPTGFDMRAEAIENSDVGPWDIGYEHIVDSVDGSEFWGRSNPDTNYYRNLYEGVLFPLGRFFLNAHKTVQTVDAELDDSNQFVYGTDFNMGDIVEIEGYTGLVGKARIVEWIQSQDSTGKKAYPGVEVIE